MADVDAIIERLRELNPVIEERWGARIIGLFGSVARGDDTPDSDIDLLYELDHPLGFGFMRMADFLEEKLERRVDLISAEYISPWLKKAISNEVRDV
ncbi:MAG: nucleotidyltransferase family protein [Rhodospirillaceae bacterium]